MQQIKNKQTHRCRQQTSGYQWGKGSREGQHRGSGLRGTNSLGINKLQGESFCPFFKLGICLYIIEL